MTVKIEEAEINSVRLAEQPSDVATPASGYGQLFVKTDGRPYLMDDGGNLIPMSLDVVSGTSSLLSGVDTISFEDGIDVGVTGSTAYVKGVSSSQDIGARVYNSASISIPDSSTIVLTFDSERYDTDGIHSTVSNTERLTCQTAGKYIITGHIGTDSGVTGRCQLGIKLNGTTYIAYVRETEMEGQVSFLSIATVYELSVGDYVELTFFQGSGITIDVSSGGNYSPEFSIQKIG